jgi:membrane protein
VTESRIAETEERRLTRAAHTPSGIAHGIGRGLPRAIDDLFRDRCPQYAASISFHVLFSLFPLTIAFFSVFGLVLQDDDLRQRVINELLDVLPLSEAGQNDVQRSIEGIASPLSALGLLSLVALLWGASGMMAAIRNGLEASFKVERGRPAAHAKAIDFLLVAITGLVVLLVVGFSAFTAFFSRVLDSAAERIGVNAGASGLLLRDVIQLAALGVMAFLLYRYVPNVRLPIRAIFAGALLTSLMTWAVTKVLTYVFTDFSHYNFIYGPLTGVMTFLFFVYVVSLILLLGAEFAYAWSQPIGPPGPPVRKRVVGFLKGLFVATPPREEEPPVTR